MSDSFINRNRKVLIIICIIIVTILVISGFIAAAIIFILFMLGVKQLMSKRNTSFKITEENIDKSKLIVVHDEDLDISKK